MKEQILLKVVEFFGNSHDFNGLLLSSLCSSLDLSIDKIRPALAALIENNQISLAFASRSGNPHIKRLPKASPEEQIEKLDIENPDTVCVYPTAETIFPHIERAKYENMPFTQKLALAEPQLAAVYFDLSVLERYFLDPRYNFQFLDYEGSIVVSDEYYEDDKMLERDKIILETFGIGYDKARNRVVVAYLRYLSRLSPDHQQFWLAHQIEDECIMNSDYARATIYGEWPEYYSAYHAFLSEQEEVNKLSQIIGKPPLFSETYKGNRPEGFIPMLRPTRQNLHSFLHLLDKLISENINIEFFRGDIDLEEQIKIADGKIEIRRIGTLNLLRNWIRRNYRTSIGDDVSDEVVSVFKEIRNARQKPAHSISPNEYDIAFPSEQDRLLGEACRSFTKLRLILSSHPIARNSYEPPSWLDSEKIVFY